MSKKLAAAAVKPPSLSEEAYRLIKEEIVNNRFQPGQQLLEAEISLSLNMSRTPIREALVRLQYDGLIEIVPRHGMRVMPLRIADMEDIYEVLTLLECRAIERLAAVDSQTSDLSALFVAMEDMEAALADDDRSAWADADDRYHLALLALNGNSRLCEAAQRMHWQIRRVRTITLNLRDKPVKSNEEHRAILEAIVAGDAKTAVDLHRQHRDRASRVLIEILRKMNLTQV